MKNNKKEVGLICILTSVGNGKLFTDAKTKAGRSRPASRVPQPIWRETMVRIIMSEFLKENHVEPYKKKRLEVLMDPIYMNVLCQDRNLLSGYSPKFDLELFVFTVKLISKASSTSAAQPRKREIEVIGKFEEAKHMQAMF